MTDGFTPRDGLRIGDQERDRVTRFLHDAFAQGRITREELDERLDSTLTARTAAELGQVLTDLVTADDPANPLYRPAVKPEYPYRGDLATWGHHYYATQHQAQWEAHRRMRREMRGKMRGRRHNPAAALPVILLVGLVAALVTGSIVPLFVVFKLMLIAGLVLFVFGLAKHSRAARRF